MVYCTNNWKKSLRFFSLPFIRNFCRVALKSASLKRSGMEMKSVLRYWRWRRCWFWRFSRNFDELNFGGFLRSTLSFSHCAISLLLRQISDQNCTPKLRAKNEKYSKKYSDNWRITVLSTLSKKNIWWIFQTSFSLISLLLWFWVLNNLKRVFTYNEWPLFADPNFFSDESGQNLGIRKKA